MKYYVLEISSKHSCFRNIKNIVSRARFPTRLAIFLPSRHFLVLRFEAKKKIHYAMKHLLQP